MSDLRIFPGSTVRIPAEITVNGVLTDPSTLEMKVQNPQDGTTTSHTWGSGAQIVRESVGKFYWDFVVPAGQHGTWVYEIVTTGTGAQRLEGEFHVERSRMSA